MSNRLKALLVLLGTVGAVTVYRLAPGVTRLEVADAGILDNGVRTTIAVEGRRLLPDGGYRYGSGHVDGVWRADEKVLIIDPPDDVEVFRPDRPRRDDAAGTVDAKTLKARQDDCACRGATGNCFVANPDGGANLLAPFGVTLDEGTFGGAGCVRKVCGGVLTVRDGVPVDETWPAGCPESAP